MSPPPLSGTPISAPDLVGPVSILNWPVAGPRAVRRRRQRPFWHAGVVFEVRPEALGGSMPRTMVERIVRALMVREV